MKETLNVFFKTPAGQFLTTAPLFHPHKGTREKGVGVSATSAEHCNAFKLSGCNPS